MTHEPTEDVPYEVDDFATPDVESDTDTPDQTVETVLIKELRQYLKEAEAEHNSFDVLDLTEQAKMTPTQQIAVHKLVVKHIRNIKQAINNKVKEL